MYQERFLQGHTLRIYLIAIASRIEHRKAVAKEQTSRGF